MHIYLYINMFAPSYTCIISPKYMLQMIELIASQLVQYISKSKNKVGNHSRG